MAVLAAPHASLRLVVEPAQDASLPAGHAQVTALYAEYGAKIHRFLRDMLGDATLAKDATQETFVRAYTRLSALDPTLRVAPWLFGIANNVSLEMRRSRARADRCFVAGLDADAAGSGSPEKEFLHREVLSVVNATLADLPEERRAMLLLRLDHGLSYDDIAVTMSCSLAKVKVEIHRAREALRAAKAAYEEGAK